MKLDHIGIATHQLDDALALWRDALGLQVEFTEEVREQGVRIAMLPVGETHIELLEPLSENFAGRKIFGEARAGNSSRSDKGDRHSGVACQIKREGNQVD